MTDTLRADSVPIRETEGLSPHSGRPVTVPVRHRQGVAYSQETVDQAFALFVTTCHHDCRAVERMMAAKAEPGEAVPTARTIGNWAKAENWSGRSDDIWRSNGKRTIYELRRAMLGNAILGQQIHRDVMTGAYDEKEPWEVAARLKAADQSNRMLERGVIALQAFDPPQEEQNREDMSLQEREAEASARLVEARKRSIGRGE
jgi:hypothetical protein